MASAIVAAAQLLLPHLERGQPINATVLRGAMESAFGASDTAGAWDWKTAYEACEVATVLMLRKYGTPLFRKAGSAAAVLPQLSKIAGQMLAAGIVGLNGVKVYWIPLPNTILTLDDAMSILLTMALIFLCVNSINLIDGLDEPAGAATVLEKIANGVPALFI